MMFASFHSKETTPSLNDTVASGMLICSSISINSFGGIPSTPCHLLFFIDLIFFATILELQLTVLYSPI